MRRLKTRYRNIGWPHWVVLAVGLSVLSPSPGLLAGAIEGAGAGSGETLQAAVDSGTRKAVERALADDPDVEIRNLQVVVEEGIVTLHGRVGTPAEKHLAGRRADDIQGAKGVVNVLEVMPGLELGAETAGGDEQSIGGQ
jgi:hypothetical protein